VCVCVCGVGCWCVCGVLVWVRVFRLLVCVSVCVECWCV